MLRPERMSKVSVTGSRQVLRDVIETVHGLNLVHVTEYDGSWEGFEPGDPVQGAEEAADRLVTVRALESTLGIEAEDAGPRRVISEDELVAELEELREEVNALDDRRDEARSELRRIEERIEAAEPFVDLGIDLDLLQGYDTLEVAVGRGDADAVEEAIESADTIRETEVFSGDGDTVAAVARPTEGAGPGALSEALVGVDFSALEVPTPAETSTDPEAYLRELKTRRGELEADLEDIESELEGIREDAAGFLLAAEEQLTIEVEKAQAPLSFATTPNAFVAEGWIPSDRYDEFEAAMAAAVDDHAEVEELERASFGADREVTLREEVPESVATVGPAGDGVATDTDAGEDAERAEEEPRPVADGGAAADGSAVVMRDDDPPVRQDNPDLVKPFELLTQAVGRPKYTELDPTVILFLTFPVLFGFMIGDLGYGLIYTAIGVAVYARTESDAFRSFGGVTIAAGLFTTLFGVFYGEIFGLHLITDFIWEPLIGHPPIEKGLSPATVEWAQAWFVITALFGVVHMTIGYTFEFVENLEFHGLVAAIEESGSWLLALNGLWLFVFSRLFAESKPDLLFTVFDTGEEAAFALGFSGLPAVVGWIGLGMVVVGLVLLGLGPTHELIEFHVVLAHALSYLRIAAVLLAKAGMAFAVNLLFFGAYVDEGGHFHFMLNHGPEWVAANEPTAEIMFGGLVHGGAAAVVGGIVVLLVGHLVVLALGVTSAGIQAVRLEYFEFFSKFYEGGGTPYSPFGQEREFTAEE